MRLGAPVLSQYHGPEQWVAALRAQGYTAAFCPIGSDADAETIRAYSQAAQEADIIIAEVGAWSNPISPSDEIRSQALRLSKERLAFAEEIGAWCCVNIAGSRGEKWDGHHADNLTDETFDLVVATVREIIDAVHPKRTSYTLETMPWMLPESADSYLRLIRAVDREAFGVHFDPVNLINSPQRYYGNAALIRDFVGKLGPHIKSCHAKDTLLQEKLTVHLDEVRPGLGNLDYRTLLRELDGLHPDLPLLIEHLRTAEDFTEAAAYLRGVAQEIGVEFR